MAKRGRPISPAQRFLMNLQRGDDENCMLMPYQNQRIGVGGATQTPQRASCHFHHGPPSEGQVLVRMCQTSGCVNPEHLRWGTRSEAAGTRKRRTKNGNQYLSNEEIMQLRSVNWGGLMFLGSAAEAAGVKPKYLYKILDGRARREAGFPPGWRNMAAQQEEFQDFLVAKGIMIKKESIR